MHDVTVSTARTPGTDGPRPMPSRVARARRCRHVSPLGALLEMGFAMEDAREALARGGGTVPGACEYLSRAEHTWVPAIARIARAARGRRRRRPVAQWRFLRGDATVEEITEFFQRSDDALSARCAISTVLYHIVSIISSLIPPSLHPPAQVRRDDLRRAPRHAGANA